MFLGKQILNNAKELGVPVVKYIIKRLLNWFKNRKQSDAEKEEEIYTRYEQDFDLPPEDAFGLFGEYLELSKLKTKHTVNFRFYFSPIYSYPVWFRHTIRRVIPVGASFRSPQQLR